MVISSNSGGNIKIRRYLYPESSSSYNSETESSPSSFSSSLKKKNNDMMSTTKDEKISVRRRTRRRRVSSGRKTGSRARVARRSCNNGGRTCCSKVSDKLKALKNLIPTQEGERVKTDQLFQQTANYIVLLRTRVVILQKLIEFYGSAETENAVS